MCSASLREPKSIVVMLIRITFGWSLVFVGISHYQAMPDFAVVVASGLGPISFLGTIWAYILPALMIVGGALFVLKQQLPIATWTTGVALASIPAGMLLKPVLSGQPAALGDVMASAINAFIWLLVLVVIVLFDSCCCDKGKERK